MGTASNSHQKGGGANIPIEFRFFVAWKATKTFLDKPSALQVEFGKHVSDCSKLISLSTGEVLTLSSSGDKQKCLIFVCLPVRWNDEEELLIIDNMIE